MTTLGGKGEGERSDDDGKPQTMPFLQFGGWSSAVDPSFWHKIAELKLNRMHLSEKEIECESEFHMSRNDGVDVPMFVNGANVFADEDDANGGGKNDKNDGIIGCWRARGDADELQRERTFV